MVKRRIEDEKAELTQTINRDRDNMTKKLAEEHDQRRIEQMEVAIVIITISVIIVIVRIFVIITTGGGLRRSRLSLLSLLFQMQ